MPPRKSPPKGPRSERPVDAQTGKPIAASRGAASPTDEPVAPAGRPSDGPSVAATTADPPNLSTLPAPLKAIVTAVDDATRRNAAVQAARTLRDSWFAGGDLAAYLARPDVTDAQKTATLGLLAVEIARAELLLGMAYVGGDLPWEDNNEGEFPKHYHRAVKAESLGKAPWCTCFAGAIQSALGFQFPSSLSYSVFWSGYRLDKWARDGGDVENKPITPAGQRVSDGVGGSRHVRGTTFQALTKALRSAPDAPARRAAAEKWLAANITPQPGDIVVLDADNLVHNSSHTVLIERYNPADLSLTTIEGNASNRVTSRRIDLTSADDVSEIASLVRLGHVWFEHAEPAAAAAPDAATLLNTAKARVRDLQTVASTKKWLVGGGPEDSAHAWLKAGRPDSIV